MLKKLSLVRLFAVLLAAMTIMPAAHAGRTVWIDTEVFYDSQAGIPALVASMIQLNNEFKPVSNEIDALNAKIANAERALSAAVAANDSAAATAQDNTLRQLQIDVRRKSEDAAAQVEKRRKALVRPIEEKVTAAMSAYAAAKGIDVILDAVNGALYISPEWQKANDATADFITWYKTQPAI